MSTLHESWHTVANLRPRLHPAATSSIQPSRGKLWRVLLHPGGDAPRRVSPAAWAFAGLLDGTRTVDRAWHVALKSHGDDALTQPEALDLLGWLATANLLRFDIEADVRPLLRRASERRLREARGRMLNPLFLRVPLASPDRLLERLRPLGGLLFSPAGAIVWTLLVLLGGATVASNATALSVDLRAIAEGGAGLLLATAVIFAAMKCLHEFAHGLAAKTLGKPHGAAGEIRSFGLQWMLVAPVPFVDVTPSWGIPRRRHRVLIGAAGMASDLLCAALAAMLWANLTPGPARLACLQVMLVAAVGTVLFNANPLVRFDGYFILSDLLDVPNLGRRAFGYVGHLIKRFGFGVRNAFDPSADKVERPWLVAYAVSAAAYRIVLCGAILALLATWWPVAALIFGTATIVAWIGLPLARGLTYLVISPELHRRRGRACALTAVAASCLVVGLGVVPFEDSVEATGEVVAADETTVRPRVAGRLTGILDAVEIVEAGDTLFSVDVGQVRADLARAEASLATALIQAREARQAGRAELAERHDLEAEVYRRRVVDLETRRSAGTQLAPHAGVWLPAQDVVDGVMCEPGHPAGRVVALKGAAVTGEVAEHVGPRLRPGQSLTLRGAGSGGADIEIVGSLESLSSSTDKGRYAFRVNEPGPFQVGSTVRVTWSLGRRPLAWQWLDVARRHLTPRTDLQ